MSQDTLVATTYAKRKLNLGLKILKMKRKKIQHLHEKRSIYVRISTPQVFYKMKEISFYRTLTLLQVPLKMWQMLHNHFKRKPYCPYCCCVFLEALQLFYFLPVMLLIPQPYQVSCPTWKTYFTINSLLKPSIQIMLT